MSGHYRGGCSCGALRYHVGAQPSSCCVCHCESCRRSAGAPFVVWATFPAEAFKLSGMALRLHRSSQHVQRGFCNQCGTALTYVHDKRPGVFDLTVASLDKPAALPPQYHIWVADKLPWTNIDDGLEQYAGWRSSG